MERHHLWGDDPEAPARLQTDPGVSIWDAAAASRANLEGLFTSDVPGLFAVVQSNTGLKASEVAVVARKHFPVRSISTEPLPASWASGRSKLGERLRVASRLAAQQIYRLRRGSRGRWRAARGAVPPNSVRDGGDRLAPGTAGTGGWGE